MLLSYMQSVLMLPVVHHAVFGAYTCIVENIHGKLEKVVMLTEGAKPGTPHINPQKIYPDGLDLYIEVSYRFVIFDELSSNYQHYQYLSFFHFF